MTQRRPDSEFGSSYQTEGPTGPSVPTGSTGTMRPTLLETVALWIGCLCAVLIFGLSFADIVLRAASVEFFVAGEANGILMAWMIFLAMAHATRTGSHLSLDFLGRHLPDWLQMVIRVFGYLVMLTYIAVLSWYCGKVAWSSYINEVRSSTILRWPVIYAQLGVLMGLALLALTQCLILIADLRSGGRLYPAHGASHS
jgi:TRAP-type C4-dicarboxylate transport system permease small subunit